QTMKKGGITVRTEDPDNGKPSQLTVPAVDPTKPLVVVRKSIASYDPLARSQNVSGVVRLRLKLSENGSISEIVVLQSLPGGLLRQAVYAAVRTKFLPREKDGKPVASVVTFEWEFKIY